MKKKVNGRKKLEKMGKDCKWKQTLFCGLHNFVMSVIFIHFLFLLFNIYIFIFSIISQYEQKYSQYAKNSFIWRCMKIQSFLFLILFKLKCLLLFLFAFEFYFIFYRFFYLRISVLLWNAWIGRYIYILYVT